MSTPTTKYGQYLRRYCVTVMHKKTKKGVQFNGIRCVFQCEKSVNDTPNYSIIKLYNLKDSTIASIKVGDTVYLEAGYEKGNFGLIFTGQVIQPKVFYESQVDSGIMLIVQDGDQFLKNSFVSKSVGKSTTKYDVVKMCIDGQDDVSVGVLDSSLQTGRLPRGKVLFGKSSKYLREAAKASKSNFYIEDGKVNIVPATSYASGTAVELNPDTGLIGRPEQTDDGVSGQCLINPSIKLNTKVYILKDYIETKQVEEGKKKYSTPSAKGVYKITKLKYEGDTHGDDWYCTFEAVTINYGLKKK